MAETNPQTSDTPPPLDGIRICSLTGGKFSYIAAYNSRPDPDLSVWKTTKRVTLPFDRISENGLRMRLTDLVVRGNLFHVRSSRLTPGNNTTGMSSHYFKWGSGELVLDDEKKSHFFNSDPPFKLVTALVDYNSFEPCPRNIAYVKPMLQPGLTPADGGPEPGSIQVVLYSCGTVPDAEKNRDVIGIVARHLTVKMDQVLTFDPLRTCLAIVVGPCCGAIYHVDFKKSSPRSIVGISLDDHNVAHTSLLQRIYQAGNQFREPDASDEDASWLPDGLPVSFEELDMKGWEICNEVHRRISEEGARKKSQGDDEGEGKYRNFHLGYYRPDFPEEYYPEGGYMRAIGVSPVQFPHRGKAAAFEHSLEEQVQVKCYPPSIDSSGSSKGSASDDDGASFVSSRTPEFRMPPAPTPPEASDNSHRWESQGARRTKMARMESANDADDESDISSDEDGYETARSGDGESEGGESGDEADVDATDRE